MRRKTDNNVITGWQNQNIEIMASTNIPNQYGGSDPNNAVYWSTYAKVKQVKAWRSTEANHSQIEFAYEFTVRYRDDRNLQNNMLLKWRGVWFTIFDYNPDVVYQDFVTFKGNQQNSGGMVKQANFITFPAIPDKVVTDPDFALQATASSGLVVTYSSSNPAVATITGNMVHLTGLGGGSVIYAYQAGSSTVFEATPVRQTLSVI